MAFTDVSTDVQIRSAEKALSVGTWLIVGGAMLYSVLTVTPLMAAHTPRSWAFTAPILPIVVDAAVVIVVRLDSTLARLGGRGGGWPLVLRWLTGAATLVLNIGDSALNRDLVGVAVHVPAPLLLIVTAETSLAYRRAITTAVNARQERQRTEQAERERAALERQEAADRRAREEREHTAALAREQRDHEARLAREQAEQAAAQRREEREAEAAREQAEREARERAEREREQAQRERERAEREAAARRDRERAEREARERAEREREQQRRERERAELLAAGPATEKLPEPQARNLVAAAFAADLPVRSAAELCGWSTGWVSSRYQDLRSTPDNTASTSTRVLEGAAA